MSSPDSPSPVSNRVVSIDAYRGFVMLLIVAESLRFCTIAQDVPHSAIWQFLCWQQSHVPWVGCSLHDLVQPSFSFLVGAVLPFSLTARRARGQGAGAMIRHAAGRALVLIVLGIFLRSLGQRETNFTFEDTLTQIGLGYVFLFLLALRPLRDQWIALALILIGYWLAFALWALPPVNFDWQTAEVLRDWPYHLDGFAAHWNKNTNAAWAFDRWFLNLFPREEFFGGNPGGYVTLSFIPTLGTMILGLIAGDVIRSGRTASTKLRWLVGAGLIALTAGWLLGVAGICPVVKRIWTPSWVLYSGGWCFLLLAAFYAVIDVAGWRKWAFPLVVVGINSIAIYCMDWVVPAFLRDALRRHFGRSIPPEPGTAEAGTAEVEGHIYGLIDPAYTPLVEGTVIIVAMWLIMFWMYRRKIFLRI